MIKRWYEISCDACGLGDHYCGNKKIAEKMARSNGWIINKGLHFCDEDCKRKGPRGCP